MVNSLDQVEIDISSEEKDKLVSEVKRYILFKNQENSGAPIKRDDLTRIVTQNYNHRQLPSVVINEAREKLSSIFGYELRELQRSRPSGNNQNRSSQSSVADVKSYVITSQLPSKIFSKFVENKNYSHLNGFAFVVIGIVHLAGGKLAEDHLWSHLRPLGLNENDEANETFGSLKSLMESLLQQRYLQQSKITGPEGNTWVYEFAERALDESVIQSLTESIAQIARKQSASVEDP